MTKKTRKSMETLGGLVDDYLSKRGLGKRLDLATAVARWADVVGARVAANARAESVTADGILWVAVRSPAWAMELSMMAPKLLARLNADRTGKIRELRCRVGLEHTNT